MRLDKRTGEGQTRERQERELGVGVPEGRGSLKGCRRRGVRSNSHFREIVWEQSEDDVRRERRETASL